MRRSTVKIALIVMITDLKSGKLLLVISALYLYVHYGHWCGKSWLGDMVRRKVIILPWGTGNFIGQSWFWPQYPHLWPLILLRCKLVKSVKLKSVRCSVFIPGYEETGRTPSLSVCKTTIDSVMCHLWDFLQKWNNTEGGWRGCPGNRALNSIGSRFEKES